MKWTIIIIILFGLTACNNVTDKTEVSEKVKTVHIDSIYFDSNEMGETYREYNNCNFDNFIADKKTPKLAKDIYLDNDWNLSNENEALALLDSLTAKNKTSRPFYFKVITLSEKKSDGYYSEGLGHAGYNYVVNNTQEFASYFDNKQCHTDNDLATWVDIVILEFSIRRDDSYDKPIVDDYINKLKSNCKDCSTAQKEIINKFGLTLKEKWNEFLEQLED